VQHNARGRERNRIDAQYLMHILGPVWCSVESALFLFGWLNHSEQLVHLTTLRGVWKALTAPTTEV
jgi:hypothetical protein